MQNSYYAHLSTNGKDRVLIIPHEFNILGTEVLLRKEGNRLIIEPVPSNSLLALLATLQDIPDDFPDVDEELLPVDDITL